MFDFLHKLGVATVLVTGLGAVSATAAVIPFTVDNTASTEEEHFVTRTAIPGELYDVFAYAAFTVDGSGNATTSQPLIISQTADGWGAKRINANTQFEGDRLGGGEALLFDFRKREVSLNDVRFTTPAGSTDDQRFDIYVRALGELTYTKVVTAGVANSGSVPVTNASFDLTGQGVVGSAFALVSLDTSVSTPRGLFLNGFSGTIAVPTPGSLAALGGGLLLGGFVLRRRKPKATS